MLKGTSQSGRDLHWHRKHLRKLTKTKARQHKAFMRRLFWKNYSISLDVAERQYQNAKAREAKRIVSPVKRFINKFKSIFKKKQHAI